MTSYLTRLTFISMFSFTKIGHGGSRTAEYLKNNLFKNLSSHPDFIKDTKSAIGEIFVGNLYLHTSLLYFVIYFSLNVICNGFACSWSI